MAKSIIMIAFFLRCYQEDHAVSAMMLNSVRNAISASSAPTPAEGRVERIVIDGYSSVEIPSTI